MKMKIKKIIKIFFYLIGKKINKIAENTDKKSFYSNKEIKELFNWYPTEYYIEYLWKYKYE